MKEPVQPVGPLAEQRLPPTANTSHTRPENRAFYPALDGLRALAFFLVFGQHYLFLPWGWTGVNFFFVLSGFLITGILYDSRDDLHRFRNFYMRRSLRIFPLYYGVLLLLLLLTPVLHWRWSAWWLAWPLYVGNLIRFLSPSALLPGNALESAASAHLRSLIFPRSELYLGHLWSLCVEEQFYLVWPLVVFTIRDRRKLIWICTLVVVTIPVLRWFLSPHLPAWLHAAEFLYRFTPWQTDALLLGGMMALLWRGPNRALLQRAASIVASVMFCVAAVYLYRTARGWPFVPYQGPAWYLTGGLPFVDLFAAALTVCALDPGGIVNRLLRVKPLRWIGRLTYGAYIFHDLLHGLYVHLVTATGVPALATDTDARRWTVAGLAMVSTLLIAWLSFRFFESPFLNLKERWTRSNS